MIICEYCYHDMRMHDDYGCIIGVEEPCDCIHTPVEYIIALLKQQEMLVDAIKELRKLTGENGEYSFCRSDGNKIGWGDALIVGDACNKVDAILEEIEKVKNE
jgi:hypothetical protein